MIARRRAAGRARGTGHCAGGRECALWQSWLDNVETLFPSCRTTLRASWKVQLRAPLAGIFTGAAFKYPGRGRAAIHQARAPGAACGSRCTCTRATAACAPTFPSTATTTNAADRAPGGGPHHGAGPQPGRRDLRRARHRHHQAGVFDRRRAAPFADYKRKVDPEGRFNKRWLRNQELLRACWTRLRRSKRFKRCAHAFCRFDQRLHAQLRADGGYESLLMQQNDIGAIAVPA